MPGDHGGAEAADQQRDHGKDTRLGEHRDADRQADTQQALDHRPLRPVETAEQFTRLVRRRPALPTGHAQRHDPHHDRRGPTAADAAHGRDTEVAINEDVVQRNIQRQPAQTQHHRRAGTAQAIAETAQHMVNGDGRQAAGDAMQILHARANQFGVDLHDAQNRFGTEQNAGRHQPHHQRQPQRLTHDRADFAVGAGAETLGDFRRGGQQSTGHQQEHRHPDRITQGHGGQVTRPDPPGHHGIDEPHGRGRQLRDHDRQRQGEQVLQLEANTGRAIEGRGGGAVGHRIQG